MALEKGKATFVDKETKAQIIGMILLQVLGIQRQADRQRNRDGGAKVMGVRGRRRPHPALCHLSTL